MRPYLTVALIDLGALAHNLGQVKRIVGSDVKIMGVVKADAYGHGLLPAAAKLTRAGADAIGVMDLDEAVRLRDFGLSLPIVVLAGFEAGHCEEIVKRDLVAFVFDLRLAEELNRTARRHGRRARPRGRDRRPACRRGWPACR